MDESLLLSAEQPTGAHRPPATFHPSISGAFEIDARAKAQLLKGLDDIDLTLRYEADIRRFEAQYDPLNPHA